MVKRKDNKGRVLKEGESQRKDLRYMYRYTDWRGKRLTVYANTLDELRAKEDKIVVEHVTKQDFYDGHIKLKTLLVNYYETRRDLSLNSKTLYDHYVEYVCDSPIGDMYISDIKTYHVKEFMRGLSAGGKSKNTIKVIMVTINNAMNSAVEDEVIPRNPIAGIKNFLPNDQKEKSALTPEEEKKLFEALDYYENDVLRDLCVVLLHTGLRISEALGLTWKDVDFGKRTITVDHQLLCLKDYMICPPKTAAGIRTVYMDDEAFQTLSKLKKQKSKVDYVVGGYSGFIFTKDGKPLRTSAIDHTLILALKHYNKDYGEQLYLSFHTLRHTFCTRLLENGVSIKNTQYIMGHSNANTTLNIYAHIDKDKAILEMKERLSI